MWEALKQVYVPQSLATRNFLRQKLLRLHYEDDSCLKEFLADFQRTCNEYISSGGALDERDKVMMLLEAMPESYRPLITALESMENLTMETATSRLLAEELRKKDLVNVKNENKANQSVAMSVKQQKKKLYCTYCKIRNSHDTEDCRKRKKANASKQSTKASSTSNASPASADASSSVTDASDFSMVACVSSASKPADSKTIQFIIDSGASDHMVSDRNLLVNIRKLVKPITVTLADQNTALTATETGDMPVNIADKGAKSGTVHNVLLIPSLRYNLLSVSRIESAGGEIHFKGGQANVYIKRHLIGTGQRKGDLYWLEMTSTVATANISSRAANEMELWHRRFGHVNAQSLKAMQKNQHVLGLPKVPFQSIGCCDTCVQSKSTRLPFNDTRTRATRPLGRIHSDVCGPIDPRTFNGFRYFVTFIDDFSHMVAVYLMKSKDETLQSFKSYEAMATSHFNLSISRLRCDNGGEYVSGEMKTFCDTKGIVLEYTTPYSPELNGVSERMNRTLAERTRSMLIEANLPKYLWGEALRTATYLINRTSIVALTGKTPYEVWYGHKPDASKLRVFGSKA